MENNTQIPREEKYATFEEKKKELKKIKWMYFKTVVGVPLLINTVLALIIIILAVFFPNSPKGMDLSFIGQFIGYVLIFSVLYLLFGIFKYIKFLIDMPPLKKDK